MMPEWEVIDGPGLCGLFGAFSHDHAPPVAPSRPRGLMVLAVKRKRKWKPRRLVIRGAR